jgi:hypothetical protein
VRGKVVAADGTHLTLAVKGGMPARYLWTDIVSVYPVVNKEK